MREKSTIRYLCLGHLPQVLRLFQASRSCNDIALAADELVYKFQSNAPVSQSETQNKTKQNKTKTSSKAAHIMFTTVVELTSKLMQSDHLLCYATRPPLCAWNLPFGAKCDTELSFRYIYHKSCVSTATATVTASEQKCPTCWLR